MKNFVIVALLGVLSGGITLQARESSSQSEQAKSLVGVPAAELPATVAKIIAQTPKQARPAVLTALLRSIAKTNPAVLKHVVVAIAKQDSTLASLAAATASKALPSSVGVIAAAAAAAVPSRAGEILAACSSATVIGQATLAQMIASINPSFNVATLVRDAAEWTSQTSRLFSSLTVKTADFAAATATGGTIYQTLTGSVEDYYQNGGSETVPPGSVVVGYLLDGAPVFGTIDNSGKVTVTAFENPDGTFNTTPPVLVAVVAGRGDDDRLPDCYPCPN